jgi:hypothetical protein
MRINRLPRVLSSMLRWFHAVLASYNNLLREMRGSRNSTWTGQLILNKVTKILLCRGLILLHLSVFKAGKTLKDFQKNDHVSLDIKVVML